MASFAPETTATRRSPDQELRDLRTLVKQLRWDLECARDPELQLREDLNRARHKAMAWRAWRASLPPGEYPPTPNEVRIQVQEELETIRTQDVPDELAAEYTLELFDNASIRKKLTVMSALDAMYDDERNDVPKAYWDVMNSLERGDKLHVYVRRIPKEV